MVRAVPPGALPADPRPHLALSAALAQAVESGLEIPCEGSTWPTSEDPDERATAAAWCPGCPVLNLCREAGSRERWGVWGGIDRSSTKPKNPTTGESR